MTCFALLTRQSFVMSLVIFPPLEEALVKTPKKKFSRSCLLPPKKMEKRKKIVITTWKLNSKLEQLFKKGSASQQVFDKPFLMSVQC